MKTLGVCAGVAGLLPAVTLAHSFGTPYVLPLPLWMYAYGCLATLVVTFAVVACFVSARRGHGLPLAEVRAGSPRYAVPRRLLVWVRAAAVGCLLVTILAGFIGSTDPARNVGTVLFWVVFLLGFAWLTLFIGDVYALVNPWKQIIDAVERSGFEKSVGRFRLPERLGGWIAFALYVALTWMELFAALTPLTLSIVLLLYTLITLAGAALFGSTAWFSRADPFSVFFRLIGTLAPVEYHQVEKDESWQARLRAPFSGTLTERPAHISVVLFVLFVLASTTYDSIHETTLWVGLYWKNALSLSQPIWGEDLGRAQSLLMGGYLLYREAGLLVFPFLYFGVYLGALLCAKALTRAASSLRTLALAFCYSLLPIAIAYHFTHYLPWVMVQSQALPTLISDPLGLGWNLLGLDEVSEPVLPMGFLWHTQITVLLAGHVVSIYLAHRVAMQVLSAQSRVILSQLPLLLLMLAYTVTGLWILSLPLAPE